MLIGIYGLIFELMNPGAILPGVIGAIALVLGLYALSELPLDYAGLALLVLGIVFMAAEAFVDLPRFRGEAWCWVSVTDVRLRRRPPCRCSSFVRPQRSPFLHPGPCAGSAAAHSPCQARAFCAPARACA